MSPQGIAIIVLTVALIVATLATVSTYRHNGRLLRKLSIPRPGTPFELRLASWEGRNELAKEILREELAEINAEDEEIKARQFALEELRATRAISLPEYSDRRGELGVTESDLQRRREEAQVAAEIRAGKCPRDTFQRVW